MFSAWKVALTFSAHNLTGNAFGQLMSAANAAHGSMDRLQSVITHLGVAGVEGLTAFGAAAVGTFAAAADAAGKYQLQMTLLQQQLLATPRQMSAIGAAISDVSGGGANTTVFSATDASRAALSLQQSGLNASQVARALKEVMFGAEIEGMRTGNYDASSYASNAGRFIKGYGLADPGNEARMAAFVDTFTRIASVTHLKSQDLNMIEQYAGTTARLSGLSEMDVIKLIGFRTQQGASASVAANELRMLLTRERSSDPKQFAALMRLGLLRQPSVTEARKMYETERAENRRMGLPDPTAGMTAKQEEAYAMKKLRATMGNVLEGKTSEQMVAIAVATLGRYQARYGRTEGQKQFLDDTRTAFNQRGVNLFGSMAVNPKNYREYVRQINAQEGLDSRVANLRQQLDPLLHHIIPNQISTLLLRLGGVTESGKPIAGGPLDIMTKLMTSVAHFLQMLNKFGHDNPEAIAKIGTLIGVLGVAGLGGASVIATALLWNFARSIIAVGAAAGFGSMRSVAGAGVGLVTGGIGSVGARLGAGLSVIFGFLGRPLLALGGTIARVFPVVTRLAGAFIPIIGRIALFGVSILNVVGWVMLAVSAVSLLWQHRLEIGKFMGEVVGWFQFRLWPAVNRALNDWGSKISSWVTNTLIPAFMNALSGLASSIGSFLADVGKKGLSDTISARMSGLQNGTDIVKNLLEGGAKNFNHARAWLNNREAEQRRVFNQGRSEQAVQPSAGGMRPGRSTTGGGHVSMNVNIHVHGSKDHDPKKIAAAVVDHINSNAAHALRAAGSSFKSPRLATAGIVGVT